MDLRRYTHANAAEARPLLVRLYGDVYTGDPVRDDDAFAQRLAGQTASPGWVGVIEYRDGEPVAYAYGMPLPADTDWWTRTAPHLPVDDDLVREDGARTFTLAEIGVRAAWRGTGLARRLHDVLLHDRPEERVVLRVLTARPRLIATYRAWGYEAAPGVPDDAKVRAMIRPTESRPDAE
nr:GNAT family N-acetyltransferase [Streptomyces sp. SID3343]